MSFQPHTILLIRTQDIVCVNDPHHPSSLWEGGCYIEGGKMYPIMGHNTHTQQ
mgnify:CR=1 FL=1